MTTDYGVCINCKAEMPTQDDARAHMTATRPERSGQSHAIHVLNPTPEQRSRDRVEQVVEAALDDALDDLMRIVEQGDLSAEDVARQLSSFPIDLAGLWREFVEASL